MGVRSKQLNLNDLYNELDNRYIVNNDEIRKEIADIVTSEVLSNNDELISKVTEEFDEIITNSNSVDTQPIEGSNNLITSDAVYKALQNIDSSNKQDVINLNGILKGNGNGVITTAEPNTDYITSTGNVASADKLKTPRTITIGNASNKTFDGSGNVTYTLTEIGAAPTSHSHSDYVPKTTTINSKALSDNITLAESDVGAVPTTRTINSKPLSANITLAASDVGAAATSHSHNDYVPTTRTINSKSLSSNITLTASDVSAAPASHNQAASTITAGTLAGSVVANATAVANLGTKQVRNIYAGTDDMTAGTSALSTGDIYIVYE